MLTHKLTGEKHEKQYNLILAAACFTMTGSAALAGDQPDHQQHVAAAEPSVQGDIVKHHDCALCGMNRELFATSRMLITYSDGKTLALCSISASPPN